MNLMRAVSASEGTTAGLSIRQGLRQWEELLKTVLELDLPGREEVIRDSLNRLQASADLVRPSTIEEV